MINRRLSDGTMKKLGLVRREDGVLVKKDQEWRDGFGVTVVYPSNEYSNMVARLGKGPWQPIRLED